MGQTGRNLLRWLVMAAVVALAAGGVLAEPERHYGQTLVGGLKYGADFKHFDFVNPDAPKGGALRQYAPGTFDSLNEFTFQGNPAAQLGLIYDPLFQTSPDEPTAQYGLIAEYATHPDDYASVTFHLREGALFNDGTPVTPEDVVFSMTAQKAANPRFGFYYKNVVKGEVTGPRDVTFTFDAPGNRELPHIVGELYVLPKHFWEGTGPGGQKRDLSKSTLEVPVGSGPYRIKTVDPGRSITYQRVADYWAKDLPVNIGQNNFDEIKVIYYRDRTPAFEAFKSGEIDVWQENKASSWATEYSFDAVAKGLVKKELIPISRVAPMQVFAFNTRRAKFQDVRVRKAFNLVFNFEALNKTVFFGAYTRTKSYFDNSELAAKGLPEGRELEILNEVKDQVPPEVFTTEYNNPVHTPENRRALLGEAIKLLNAAGWTAKDGTLVNAKGEPFGVEFLLDNPAFQPVVLPFADDLKTLGIAATVRMVDPSQEKKREDDRDFDIIVDNTSQSISPGNEQRDFWGSASADAPGSRNNIGIKNPAIDKIVDHIVFAKDRTELVAATRALDRVLLWNYYVVPQWHLPFERLAYWDIFGRPTVTPSQQSDFQRLWWIDSAKQATLNAARGK